MVLDLEDDKTNINFNLNTHFSPGQITGMPEGFYHQRFCQWEANPDQ